MFPIYIHLSLHPRERDFHHCTDYASSRPIDLSLLTENRVTIIFTLVKKHEVTPPQQESAAPEQTVLFGSVPRRGNCQG